MPAPADSAPKSLRASLALRLLLATLPAIASPWLAELWDWLLRHYGPTHPLGSWYAFSPPLLDVAFALLVLAPFARLDRWFAARVLGLVIVAVSINDAMIAGAVASQWALGMRPSLRFATAVPIVAVASCLMAAATAWIAPLHLTRRGWWYAALAGAAAASIFLVLGHAAVSGYGFELLPWWAWHVGLCAAIYCGSSSRYELR